MHKRKAAISCGICTILPQWAAEFCELARGIWQNLPRKTMGTTHVSETVQNLLQMINLLSLLT